jgi:hypothetical protein
MTIESDSITAKSCSICHMKEPVGKAEDYCELCGMRIPDPVNAPILGLKEGLFAFCCDRCLRIYELLFFRGELNGR